MPEYVVIAYGPDRRQTGDHVAGAREDAIEFVRHCLDDESRDGACVMINVVEPDGEQDDKRNR